MLNSKLRPVKYINDPVYGGIPITQIELEIIDTPIFQRLRGLKQLAHVNYVFPGAEHSRYVHSLGVLFIMGLMTEHLLKSEEIVEEDAVKMRIAALLHDIGHYPLSHLGETVYGYCKGNKTATNIVEEFGESEENVQEPMYVLASAYSKSAHHEQLGKYIVENNQEIVTILQKYNLDPCEIGDIFTGNIGSRNMVYSQLLHSSLDADRLDYLLRDSYQTGVKYGLVDLQYLIRLLKVVKEKNDSTEREVLVCNKKGQHVVEHFLMSRYFHYSQVVFHKTNAAFEGMIKAMYIKLIQKSKFMYNSLEEIKENINEYEFLNFNDANLYVALKSFYEENVDSEFNSLYESFIERKRSKVVYELKNLYEDSPTQEFAVLKRELKKNPQSITNIVGTPNWGYQVVPIQIERIQSHYTLTEGNKDHEEELREAIKVVDEDGNISYLAEDNLSLINKLANFKSEFIRIFVLEERDKDYDYDKMNKDIASLISQ